MRRYSIRKIESNITGCAVLQHECRRGEELPHSDGAIAGTMLTAGYAINCPQGVT
jgi:hypothetical protein